MVPLKRNYYKQTPVGSGQGNACCQVHVFHLAEEEDWETVVKSKWRLHRSDWLARLSLNSSILWVTR